jgi:hypothetical protein
VNIRFYRCLEHHFGGVKGMHYLHNAQKQNRAFASAAFNQIDFSVDDA